MLEKLSVIDQIDVMRDGSLHVRRADLIMEDEVEIAKTYHRNVLNPGDDLSEQDERVSVVANVVWTPEVIKEYKDRIARDEEERKRREEETKP